MPIDHDLRLALPPVIRPREIDEWISWHRNIRQPVQGYFDIPNEAAEPRLRHYRKTAANIRVLLAEAVRRDVQVRPFGGTWSFSNIAVSSGWMVDTAYLNWMFRVDAADRAGAYADDDEDTFLIQAGTKISEINRVLERTCGRSLNTTGASNGQTIAGAIGTGTHGSAIDQGGIQNHVIGLHLITGPDSDVWLERASDPATVDGFADKIAAELIRDDDLFNAALVSFGGLGFVAGVMIKTVPIFRLEAHRDWVPYDTLLKTVLESLDFTGILLPGQKADDQGGDSGGIRERPYFFQAVINPFDLEHASITAMYRREYQGEDIDYALHDSSGPGYELLGALGALTDVAGALVAPAVKLLGREQLKPFAGQTGTVGETFDFTTPRTDALGAALGLRPADVPRVIDLLLDEQQNGSPAPLVFACRYVRHSGGTLEFTQHDLTCVIDIDGVNSNRAHNFLVRAWARLEREAIPHTQHWGKINNYDPSNLRARYGDARVDAWRAARDTLLITPENKALFASPFLERIGLA